MSNFWIIRSAIYSLPSYSWIEIFKNLGFKIYGIDIKSWNIPNYVDKFSIVPPANEKNEGKLIENLIKIIHEVSPKWIISGPENEIEIITKYEKDFLKFGTRIFHPPLETIKIITNKYLLFKNLKNIINLPQTFEFIDFSPKNKKYIIKPKKGRGSKDVIIFDKKNNFTSKIQKEKYIIQEYLDGQEYSADVLFDFDGNILNVVIRKRLDVDSGISIYTETFYIKQIINQIEIISNKLIFRGMMNFQFIEKNGDYYLTDVNPRFGGGSIISWCASNEFKQNLKNLLLMKWGDLKKNCYSYKKIKLVRFYKDIIIENDKMYNF